MWLEEADNRLAAARSIEVAADNKLAAVDSISLAEADNKFAEENNNPAIQR